MQDKQLEQVTVEFAGKIKAHVTGRWPILAGIAGGLIAWLAYLASTSV